MRKRRKRDGHSYTGVSEVSGGTEGAGETHVTFPEVNTLSEMQKYPQCQYNSD